MSFSNLNAKDAILLITPYSLEDCSISVFSNKWKKAIDNKFKNYNLKICSLSGDDNNLDDVDIIYSADPKDKNSLISTAEQINRNTTISLVIINFKQSLFEGYYGENFLYLLYSLNKPVITFLHEVGLNPDHKRRQIIKSIISASESIFVTNQINKELLINKYNAKTDGVEIIPYGQPFYQIAIDQILDSKYSLENGIVITSIVPLALGSGIEVLLLALAELKNKFSDFTFIILSHPFENTLISETEKYLQHLKKKIKVLKLEENIKVFESELNSQQLSTFIIASDVFLIQPHLNYNGTINENITRAFSSGCAVVAPDQIYKYKGYIAPENSYQYETTDPNNICEILLKVLDNRELRNVTIRNAYASVSNLAFENIAIKTVNIINKVASVEYNYHYPVLKTDKLLDNTDHIGIYRKDCFGNKYYLLKDTIEGLLITLDLLEFQSKKCLKDIVCTYHSYIQNAIESVDAYSNLSSTISYNNNQNISDKESLITGTIIHCLGKIIYHERYLPKEIAAGAKKNFNKLIKSIPFIKTPKELAACITGLYYFNYHLNDPKIVETIDSLAEKLLEKFYKASEDKLHWEEYYQNISGTILPQTLLLAYKSTGKESYKFIAKFSFDLLLSEYFQKGFIKISEYNKAENSKQSESTKDIAEIVQTLGLFYQVFKDKVYQEKLIKSYEWFLGKNALSQQVYCMLTDQCYPGISEEGLLFSQDILPHFDYLKVALEIAKLNLESPKTQLENRKKPKKTRKNASQKWNSYKQEKKLPVWA